MSVAFSELIEPEIAVDDSPFEPARLTVETYHRLIDSGVFDENDRFELLEGALVAKMIKKPPRATCSHRFNRSIVSRLPARWFTRQQDPLTLGDSEPEPDLAVVRGESDDYSTRHPCGHDVGMVGEVADSSLAKDRRKARVYGRAGIPYYWIINLVDRRVECYSDPVSTGRRAGYKTLRIYSEDDSIPLVLDGVETGRIAVGDLLPPTAAE